MGELVPGDVIGSYQIVKKIGQGGMGAVYEALHEFTRRRAALKVMHAFRADEDYRTRMVQEIRALAELDHPNVVRLLDGNVTPDGHVWMAMEYLEGVTLRAVMSRHVDAAAPHLSRMPLDVALDFVIDACDGIGAGHEIHIVHRDLKPENIFLATERRGARSSSPELVAERFRVKILDFGAAKAPHLGVRHSTEAILAGGGERRVLGTPAYMSPEHLQGYSVDERTDLYALGIILYEMLHRHPFWNEDGREPHLWEMVRRQIEVVPPPLHRITARVPADLSLVVQRAIEKDAARRWPSITVLAAELRACRMRSGAPAPRAESPPMSPSELAPRPEAQRAERGPGRAPLAVAGAPRIEPPPPRSIAGPAAMLSTTVHAAVVPTASAATPGPHASPPGHARSRVWAWLGVLSVCGAGVTAAVLGFSARSSPARDAEASPSEEPPAPSAAASAPGEPPPPVPPVAEAAGASGDALPAPRPVAEANGASGDPLPAPPPVDPPGDAADAGSPHAATASGKSAQRREATSVSAPPMKPSPPRAAAPKPSTAAAPPASAPAVNLLFGPK